MQCSAKQEEETSQARFGDPGEILRLQTGDGTDPAGPSGQATGGGN